MKTYSKTDLLAEQAIINEKLAISELFGEITTKCPGFWALLDVTHNDVDRQSVRPTFGLSDIGPLCSPTGPATPLEFYMAVASCINKNISWAKPYLTKRTFAVFSNKWVMMQDLAALTDYELSVVIDYWNKVTTFSNVVIPYSEKVTKKT